MLRRNTRTLIKLLLVAATFLGVIVLLARVLNPAAVTQVHHPMAAAELNDRGGLIMPRPPPEPVLDFQLAANEEKQAHKIDWHDYGQMAKDANRTGPGEQGLPVITSANDDEHRKKELYRVNGFNAYASDKIALDRSLPDIRHPLCRKKVYEAKLPTVSVIVPFHNEHWSTLLRTVYSVINRSPERLLRQIILVDDCSTKEHAKDELDKFIAAKLSAKVSVIHSPKRVGLIRARLLGARVATGDVLIFLDSHSEANVNWLPPLLEPIAQNDRTAVCPFIDVIDFETFAYRAQDEGARGAFDWEFFYKRLPLLPADLERPTEPFKNPVMAGGLFAIGREFFWKLGGYDDGLEIWGGEQYELSFKIWQCGGEMYDAPCSRVGHIYRKFAPFPNPGIGDFVGRNYRRVADVWMDDYAKYLYARRPQYLKLNPGDLSAQRSLRERLECKPFSWFIDTIAFDLPKKYPPVEPPHYAQGEIRNAHSTDLCIDTKHRGEKESFGVDVCIKDKGGGLAGAHQHHSRFEQEFALTWHKDVRPKSRNVCFDVSSNAANASVFLWNCHGSQGNQLWRYNMERMWLVAGHNNRCLDCDPDSRRIFVSECSVQRPNQRWKIEKVDSARLASWNSPDN